ncbi:hypothetical protein DPMN_063910 [Dreissena polymorpha]|uniref:Uncharacterized protein n=1 Tax=Dreissena polymorpha TaxID=45954 RepID=A0A9D4CBE5_DREPO|nr:hypothetical protein DPMN_063910 [Dreissena polymorpha]
MLLFDHKITANDRPVLMGPICVPISLLVINVSVLYANVHTPPFVANKPSADACVERFMG